jgi:hypothetical protein
VFFPDGRAFLYVWAEKDFLKSFRWRVKRFETTPTMIATNESREHVLTPPYVAMPKGVVWGMPGGMLALTIDPKQPAAGVLFASVQRCRSDQNDQPHECSLQQCRQHPLTCWNQDFGMLRAFDPITLEELWNSQLDLTSDANKTYFFAKFVPPTIAHGRVFLPTGSGRVLVYGRH